MSTLGPVIHFVLLLILFKPYFSQHICVFRHWEPPLSQASVTLCVPRISTRIESSTVLAKVCAEYHVHL